MGAGRGSAVTSVPALFLQYFFIPLLFTRVDSGIMIMSTVVDSGRAKVKKLQLGEQELQLLRFLAEHPAITAAEVVAGYAAPGGLARTTALTMLERLRKKGYLTRVKDDTRVFRYTSCLTREELEQTLVADFMRRMLGGSLRPFAAYIAETGHLSSEEEAELRALLERIEHSRKAEP